MYDYRMIKSIHDQRMRQFMIEAERAHLLRMLASRRPEPSGWSRGLEALASALRRVFVGRPQPAV